MPPFSWIRCWSPSVLCLWRGKNKGTVGRVTGVARRPHLVPGVPATGIGLLQPFSHSCVKPDGLLCARHHAGPRTQSTARAEKGLGQGWRPKSEGTTEKPALWLLAHRVPQAHRRDPEIAPLAAPSCDTAPFPEEGPDCTALPGPGREHWLVCVGCSKDALGGGGGHRETAARLC